MDVEKWNIETLIDACSSNPEGKKKLEIPKFQRRREWKQIQEDELIETMRSNKISIGALQLFHRDTKDKTDKYLLVDGLHRASTLTKYFNDPFCFNRTQNLIDEVIEEVIGKYKKSYEKDEIEKMCRKWFCKKMLGCYQEFIVDKLFNEKYEELKEIVGKLADKKDKEPMSKFIIEKTRDLCKEINISKTHIPVILNVGDEKILPILFRRINQNGTPLKPCDVLAAKWHYSKKIEIKNKKIIDNIKTHYEEMSNENNKMDIYNEDSNDKMFTAYEYIIGLRGYLMGKYEDTFLGKIKDKEFMFKLLACCILGDMTKKSIDNLKDKIVETNLTILEESLIWAFKFITNAVDSMIILETTKQKMLIKDIPTFIVMIATAYKKKSKIQKNEEFYKTLFRGNLLNCKLSDAKFNSKGIKLAIDESKFLSLIHKKEFSERIGIFMSENNRQKGKKDKITLLSLLILKVISDAAEILESEVEIGMIVGKKAINTYCKEKKCSLSMYGIGNLCLYSSGEKKKKPQQSITKYLESLELDNDDIYDKYLSMGDCIEYDDIINDQEIDEKHYANFLKYRTACIKDKLIDIFSECFKKAEESESESDEDDSKSDSGSESEEDDDSNSESDSGSESDSSNKPKKKVVIKQVGSRTVMTKK